MLSSRTQQATRFTLFGAVLDLIQTILVPDAERSARRRSGTKPPRVRAANEAISAADTAPTRSRPCSRSLSASAAASLQCRSLAYAAGMTSLDV
jgi:hypothetical protein